MQLEIRKATVGHQSGWAIWDIGADRAHARWLWKTKKAAAAEVETILQAQREEDRREAENIAKREAEAAQRNKARMARIAHREAVKLDMARQLNLF